MVVAIFIVSIISVSAQENVSINNIIIGDTDPDGFVTITDATKIQCYLAQILQESSVGEVIDTESENQYLIGDVDLNGRITIMDATAIQCYIARLRDNGAIGRTIYNYENRCVCYVCEGHVGSHGTGRINEYGCFYGSINGISGWCSDNEIYKDSQGNCYFYDDNKNGIKDADESYMYQCKGNCTGYHYDDIAVCDGHIGSHGIGKPAEGDVAKFWGCLNGIGGWCSNINIRNDLYWPDDPNTKVYECKGNCVEYHYYNKNGLVNSDGSVEYCDWDSCNNKTIAFIIYPDNEIFRIK